MWYLFKRWLACVRDKDTNETGDQNHTPFCRAIRTIRDLAVIYYRANSSNYSILPKIGRCISIANAIPDKKCKVFLGTTRAAYPAEDLLDSCIEEVTKTIAKKNKKGEEVVLERLKELKKRVEEYDNEPEISELEASKSKTMTITP